MEPLISLKTLGPSNVYPPGGILECEYQIDAVEESEVTAVETSVLWHTEGKGEEDMAVHFFERRVAGEGEPGDLRQLYRFSIQLPNSPLTYSGSIVKIRWCVRVRAFLKRGKEVFFEEPFIVGNPSRPIPETRAVTRDKRMK